LKGERRETDKGIKGHRTERKKVKDENTRENILNFEGFYL
jgi:hypothetical protein